MTRYIKPPPSPSTLTSFSLRWWALSHLTHQFPDTYLPWRLQRFHDVPAEANEEFAKWVKIGDARFRVRQTNTEGPPLSESDWIVDNDPTRPPSREEWWSVLRAGRNAQARQIPSLTATDGNPFRFALTDDVLRSATTVAALLGGALRLDVDIALDKDRYIRSALEEEAITSSQLEGAITTRVVAQEMLRSGRQPRDTSERMILNNFNAMLKVGELRDQLLTPDLVREIQAIVTDGTLSDPSDAGRLQVAGETRVVVVDTRDETVVHEPPPADELPDRLDRLCEFANGVDTGPYLPEVLRALTLHFMVSYNHFFVDGNGRTARALFYWSMLHHGYWLTEYLTISTILHKAFAQYGASFRDTEEDGGDLTYFFIYHLDVLRRAIDGLRGYVRRTVIERRAVQQRLDPAAGEFNLRQITILAEASADAQRRFTAGEVARRFSVTEQTGRNDLSDLETRHWLVRHRVGHSYVWQAGNDLTSRLGDAPRNQARIQYAA